MDEGSGLDRLTRLFRGHPRGGDGRSSWELVIDGKPLPVGRCSKDPDAKGGRLGRGYKLHLILGYGAWPEAGR